jgi:diguanylate cyclase (GGDEF)-like protein
VYALAGGWVLVLGLLALYGDLLKRHSYLVSLSAPVFLSLSTQWTGGWASPLSGFLFPLVALWAWFLGLRHAMAGAGVFIALSLVSEWRDLPAGPYLAGWLSALGFFLLLLKKVAEIRRQKEQAQKRFDHLRKEARDLADAAEPASFQGDAPPQGMRERSEGARLATLMNLEESLKRQMVLAREALGAHTVGCLRLAKIGDKDVLRMRAISSQTRELTPDLVIALGETLLGLTAKERHKLLVDPLSVEAAKTLPYYARPQEVRSFLSLPILLSQGENSEPELAGVFFLDDVQEGRFDEQQVALAEAFAAQAGETIRGSRVLHFSGTMTRNLKALNNVSSTFSTLLDEERVVQATWQTARDMYESDSALVALAVPDPTGAPDLLMIRAGHGVHRPGQVLTGLDEELSRHVLQSRSPIRYEKGARGEVSSLFQRRDNPWSSIQSCLMVPLMGGDRALGVLRLDSRQSDAFQVFDQGVLQTLANQAGLALENARRVRQVEELAIRDGLTGLFNHRHFQERLSEELTKADRYHKDLSLVLMDVDHFKKFNDQYGHPEGDRVLKAVADALTRSVRQKVDMVARYGGEEFVALLPETGLPQGRELAERIRQKVESLILRKADGSGVYRVTMSLGVATFPFDAREPGRLIHLADEALYRSKGAGRNRVTVYSDPETTTGGMKK